MTKRKWLWSALRASLAIAVLWMALVAALPLSAEGRVPASLPARSDRTGSNHPDNASPASWSSFHYFFAPGSSLRPRDHDTAWDYFGVGCVYASSGTDLFTMHLDLPEGSRIDYLRLYYYDTSSSDSRAWITTYDAAGGYSDLATVASTGTGGYGTQLGGYLGHVVDKAGNAYALNWAPHVNGTSMALCGLRVAYRLPTLGIFLPTIMRQF